jgi:hypothetical protein
MTFLLGRMNECSSSENAAAPIVFALMVRASLGAVLVTPIPAMVDDRKAASWHYWSEPFISRPDVAICNLKCVDCGSLQDLSFVASQSRRVVWNFVCDLRILVAAALVLPAFCTLYASRRDPCHAHRCRRHYTDQSSNRLLEFR